MKSRWYLLLFLLLVPLQASLLKLVSVGGITPDLGLALLYIIGLLTGPVEAALAGMGIGLLQDIGSAGLIGLTAITRGLVGLSIGLLGKNVIDVDDPANSMLLAAISLLEGCFIALFMQMLYGSVPFLGLLAGRLLPQALYTSLLGAVLLHFAGSRRVMSAIKRRTVQKEF